MLSTFFTYDHLAALATGSRVEFFAVISLTGQEQQTFKKITEMTHV